MPAKPVRFLVFFLLWAKVMRWKVPALHVRVCLWLEECSDPTRVLLIFRGAAKSTIYAVYKAWRYYRDPTHRSLVWSEDTKLAKKMSRDTIAVLRRHPLCRGLLPQHVGSEEFWVAGSVDARNPSMAAYGVLSNATGSRADAVDFDDVEVPKNIRTADAREKLRERISEATHILVPGGQETYIGTPHTSDSIYTEQIDGGAAALKIPLFEHHVRYDAPDNAARLPLPFKAGPDGYYVFVGIGRHAKLLEPGLDYAVSGSELVLTKPTSALVDVYAGCAWPERFDRADLARRRRRTRTVNAWDSQYGLAAKPMHMIRLDPDRIRRYSVEPRIERAGGGVRMMLGEIRIASAMTYWDCALGKLDGNDSVLAILLVGENGHLFLHVNEALHGDLEVLDARGKIVGGQCFRVRELLLRLSLGGVNVETNGPGGFVPAILRKHLKGTGCAVVPVTRVSGTSKNKLILDAFEPALSSRILWAHTSVMDGPFPDQLRDWRPDVKDQPDDYIDAPAGAITESPVRIGRLVAEPDARREVDTSWRPDGGVAEAVYDPS